MKTSGQTVRERVRMLIDEKPTKKPKEVDPFAFVISQNYQTWIQQKTCNSNVDSEMQQY
jgi:hypothetical protein